MHSRGSILEKKALQIKGIVLFYTYDMNLLFLHGKRWRIYVVQCRGNSDTLY